MGENETLFKSGLEAAEAGIKDCIRGLAGDFPEKGAPAETEELYKYIEAWFNCLKEGLFSQLEKIKAGNCSVKEWDEIKVIAIDQVSGQFNLLFEFIKGIPEVPGTVADMAVSRREGLEAQVSGFIEENRLIAEQKEKSKPALRVWQIFRMVMFAALGYIMIKYFASI